jgi:hypothetical protein
MPADITKPASREDTHFFRKTKTAGNRPAFLYERKLVGNRPALIDTDGCKQEFFPARRLKKRDPFKVVDPGGAFEGL